MWNHIIKCKLIYLCKGECLCVVSVDVPVVVADVAAIVADAAAVAGADVVSVGKEY